MQILKLINKYIDNFYTSLNEGLILKIFIAIAILAVVGWFIKLFN